MIPFKAGDSASYSRTMSASDVALFCGVTGNCEQINLGRGHLPAITSGRIVVPSVLVFCLTGAAQLAIMEVKPPSGEYVSAGYNDICFLQPVVCGDTLTAVYTVTGIDLDKMLSQASLEIVNQRGEAVCTAVHIMKWFQL